MSDTPSRPGRQQAGHWQSVDTDWYDSRWSQLEADGHNPHGEADFVMRFSPTSVLDAGCGTGRVAIELARRGVDAIGVDLDLPMIEAARDKAPELPFHHDNLATVQLERTVDLIVMAGNVMIFVAPGTEAQVIANMAEHLDARGILVAGFQLHRAIDVSTYEAYAAAAGLEPVEHWSTWNADPATPSDDYAVLVHRKP